MRSARDTPTSGGPAAVTARTPSRPGSPGSARMIVEAVDALPSSVDAAMRELKQIGKRILDVVAPEVGECHEAAVAPL